MSMYMFSAFVVAFDDDEKVLKLQLALLMVKHIINVGNGLEQVFLPNTVYRNSIRL